MCISDKAYALYDGGWRSTDKEEMLDVYDGLTEKEAESICDELAELERRMENGKEKVLRPDV